MTQIGRKRRKQFFCTIWHLGRYDGGEIIVKVNVFARYGMFWPSAVTKAYSTPTHAGAHDQQTRRGRHSQSQQLAQQPYSRRASLSHSAKDQASAHAATAGADPTASTSSTKERQPGVRKLQLPAAIKRRRRVSHMCEATPTTTQLTRCVVLVTFASRRPCSY